MLTYLVGFLLFNLIVFGDESYNINLPKQHLPYYFNAYPDIAEKCRNDDNCTLKDYIAPGRKHCWGYEEDCEWHGRFVIPSCPGDHEGWVKTKFDQLNTFYTQSDFGFIKQQLKELKLLCEPIFQHDSSLECSDHLRFCRGRNIMINFTSLVNRDEPLRYKMDILKDGDIGGYCEFHRTKLEAELDHISPLQSWGPELRNFRKLDRRPIFDGDCDVVIEKPTFIMKIDATVNMYHHFCDFFNLYMSQHLNATHSDAFSTDVHILVWESFTYHSSFSAAFEAFTTNPIWDLKTFKGNSVCFKNVVFPLLPRMIFGLYYNTPIIYGCKNSGLFRAFSEHVLHRLEIPLHERKNKRFRVTLLSRDTKYRRILNENELVEGLLEDEEYDVQRVVYNRKIGFKQQLEITRNTDIFIGMHGAGLTHLLFLPDWAGVFELYNCEDENCYMDLARLRGLHYQTWENSSKLIQQDQGTHPDGGAHAKFTNYSFDVEEFLRLVKQLARNVSSSLKFQLVISNVKNETKIEDHDEL